MKTRRSGATALAILWIAVIHHANLVAEEYPVLLPDESTESIRGTTAGVQSTDQSLLSAAVDGSLADDESDSLPLQRTAYRRFQVDPVSPQLQPFQVQPEAPQASQQLAASIFGDGRANRNQLSRTRRRRAQTLTADVVLGSESRFRATTDTGNLISKSANSHGVSGKQRSAIITSPSIRGSNVGQLLASGSYWFPARQDLDTLLSKIDSREINDIIVIKGPYAARYGPGFNFIDLELLRAPRYDDYESHGSSSLEYKSNGEQWYGRDAVWGGDEDWGYRVAYGHRTGSDYSAGNGDRYIASYKSRDVNVAIGYDLDQDSHVDFSYIRLDQSDVEIVTQLLDLDYLVTIERRHRWLVLGIAYQCRRPSEVRHRRYPTSVTG